MLSTEFILFIAIHDTQLYSDILCGLAALGMLLVCIRWSGKCRQPNYLQLDELSAAYVGTEMIKSERHPTETAFS